MEQLSEFIKTNSERKMKKKVNSLNGLLILTLSSVLQNETNIMKLIKILKNWLSDSNLLGSFQNWSSHHFLSMLILRQAYFSKVLAEAALKRCSYAKVSENIGQI